MFKKLLSGCVGLLTLGLPSLATNGQTNNSFDDTFMFESTVSDEEHVSSLDLLLDIEPRAKDYIGPIEDACKKRYIIDGEEFSIDPELVVALVKFESSFNNLAVSEYGAAGAAQFMPHIAWGMGMNVYMPDYWVYGWIEEYGNQEEEIQDWLKEKGFSTRKVKGARDYRRDYERYASFGDMGSAKVAWEKSREKHMNSQRVMRRYRSDLLSKARGMTEDELREFDQRLVIDDSVSFCVDYLINSDKEYYLLTKERYDVGIKHDLRVMIASYHAGLPNVFDSGGIPSIGASIRYQNKIYAKYLAYKEYLDEYPYSFLEQ